MRALACLALVSGCNFFTADLEDGAPVRTVTGPGRSTAFGTGVVGLPVGTCGSAGGLVVGGHEPDGPRLYLVTFGVSGASTRSTINDFHANFLATDEVVALRLATPRPGVIMPIYVQTTNRTFEVNLDSDCNGGESDVICDDFCTPSDAATAPAPPADLAGNEAPVDLLGDGDPVTVTGSSGGAAAAGGALSGSRTILIPEEADDAGLGGAVSGMPFDGPSDPTEELAVGGSESVLLFFRTGLSAGGAFDCDPRDGAPADVACH